MPQAKRQRLRIRKFKRLKSMRINPIACSPTPGSVSMIIFKGAFGSFSAMALLNPLEMIVQKSEHVCETATNLIIGQCYEVVDVLRDADFRIE